ncbi:lytic transglycosylase domain-containing protein [Streptacidiphilus monticola]|uniref:Lytic transglycosylase domain-containing protein n=1 Tax=Streptacidiphilus monticola TaxID=2161674 RepID=A0ABW1G2N7_9ACTN
MSRISVRGMAVASATAVTAVGAVVGVASGEQQPTQVVDAAGSTTLLADISSGQQAQTVSDHISAQADAQQSAAQAAAQKAAAEAARIKAANAAKAKAAAEARAQQQAAARAASRATLAKAYTKGSVQAMALSIIGSETQYVCFSNIVTRESGWNYTAENAASGAYGLVQALPGSKMASVGADWRTNPATQIKWGLNYMNSRYGSPCGAWSFWQAHNWY